MPVSQKNTVKKNKLNPSSSNNEMRLHKFMARSGVCSRRKAEQLIIDGRVMVNGQVINTLGFIVDSQKDEILVNRKRIQLQPKGIVILHKPTGVISTLSDPEGRRTIADFLGKPFRSYFPAGRLDWDSSGLMVITNDGILADRLMHPRFGQVRVYHVRVKGRVSDNTFTKLLSGVMLEDGSARFKKITFLRDNADSTWLEVQLLEGRNRIIRRMFTAVGHDVVKLRRIAHGPFRLKDLPVGRMRTLSEKEYQQYFRKIIK